MESEPPNNGSSRPIDLASLFSVAWKTAIVTGASSGLSERFARVLHAAGAHVMVAARRLDRLEALVAELARVSWLVVDGFVYVLVRAGFGVGCCLLYTSDAADD